ncbi:MAG: hypothetical protein ACO1N1_02585 [Dyadobacter fermentans]
MKAANKVLLNTGVLYGRMLVTMGITLYSTRLVLDGLGSADYGIFNLIAGVIAMLSFLNSAMATSTQRYLSFHQGKKDVDMQKKVFKNSLFMHICLGVGIVIALEGLGFLLFDGVLNIPANRVDAARTIYHFMSLTVFFTIIAVPFNGSLVAHENMVWVAVVNITETILKLAIAILLVSVTGDRLITYGFLMALITVVSFGMYALFCFKKYPECTLSKRVPFDRALMKELTSFAGWNLFGSLCSLGRTQGLAVLLNVFFGTVVNAAYGIANQVASQLNFFSETLLRAINPQIMKSEGAADRGRVLKLSMIASKFSFFLLAIFAIPCIFEMKSILALWLKTVPEYTAVFCSLILVCMLVKQLTIGVQSALQATGEIRAYQIVVGTTLLMNLPIAWVLLTFRLPAYSVLVSYMFIEVLSCALRLYFAKIKGGLSISQYANRVFLKEALPLLFSLAACWVSVQFIQIPLRFLFTGAFSAFVFLISIYFFGLCDDEREIFGRIFITVKKKFVNEAGIL